MSGYLQNISTSEIISEPLAAQVRLRDGRVVSLKGSSWTIEAGPEKIIFNWKHIDLPESHYLNTLKKWIISKLERVTVRSAFNGYKYIRLLIEAPSFQEAVKNDAVIPYLAFSQAIHGLDNQRRWKMHSSREFYRWAVSKRNPYFSKDVLDRIETHVIGGNEKGKAVRSEDPDKGPLNEMEVQSLCIALRAAYIDKSMSLEEQVAVLLCLAFGANASQYAMMRESDVDFVYEEEQLIATFVKVPRHKKRGLEIRDDFKIRKVNKSVSAILYDYIESNRYRKIDSDNGEERPLFWNKSSKTKSNDMIEWTWHCTSFEFANLVKAAVLSLGNISRSATPLKITPRRFRYTLATRLLQEGASPYAVAAALDHSDLQNVQTYSHLSSGILDHINPAVAIELGKRAQAFTQIVASEADAVNGDKRSSRRYFGDRERDIFEPIGNCGHNALCNVAAPLACYVCPKFQPWLDGPHEMVLESLIDRRNKRQQTSSDMRMVGLEDEILVAVANVVSRIDALKQVSS